MQIECRQKQRWPEGVMEVQRIFDPGCMPPKYQEQGKKHSFPDLTGELCPQCQAGLLKRHGFYARWLCVPGFEGQILVRRFLCRHCGRTLSLLPSFAHPRRGCGIRYIIGILTMFYLKGMSASGAAAEFQKTAGLACSRQLLLQFRKRFENNLNRLIMETVSLLNLQSPPVTAPGHEKRQRAREFLESIQSLNSEDVSLKLFERSGTAFLSSRAS